MYPLSLACGGDARHSVPEGLSCQLKDVAAFAATELMPFFTIAPTMSSDEDKIRMKILSDSRD
jgi:hypothetical protein